MLKTLLVLAVAAVAFAADLEEVFSWKQMEFQWPSAEARDEAVKSGKYVPENNLPLGMARWKNKLFITVPRWKSGVASSMNYIDLDKPNKTAALIPYPDWKANTLPDQENQKLEENHIASVFRVNVDSCDRLWVMDTGVADIVGNTKLISKPALVVFDLNTDKLIRRYEFKATDLKEDSFFANVVVDTTPDKCDQAFAYIPDLGGYGLVVYSWGDNDSWRVKHNYFHFDPLQGDMTVGGVNFQWTDGVFGVALSKIQNDGYRTAYFHPLASTKEFSVNTRVLQNKTIATDHHSYNLFKIEGEKGEKSQSSTGIFDEQTGILLLTQLQKDGVACWNTKKPLNSQNVGHIVEDKERLIFTNDIALDDKRHLYILSDKMPAFLYRSLDGSQVNYRILRANVDDLVKGSVCV